MDKILILGCSFSNGSWKAKDKSINKNKEFQIVDDILIKNSKGWYHYVNRFRNKDVTVISTPGCGYWGWYQILLYLHEENKLDYNEIWIQETYEPRIVLLHIKDLGLKFIGQHNIIDNIKLITFDNKEKHRNLYLGAPPEPAHNYFLKHISIILADKIQEIISKQNIKGYVWTMVEPIMNCNKFRRLLPQKNSLHETMHNKELLCRFMGHQTEEGNKYLGELINNEMG